MQFVAANADELRRRYPVPSPSLNVQAYDDAPGLTGIHISQLGSDLIRLLVDAGVGGLRTPESQWVGVHHRLAEVYSCAFAERLATLNRLHPITDRDLAHAAVGGWTIPRMADILLSDGPRVRPAGADVDYLATFLTLAFQTVIPKNLDAVPVDTILRVRRDLGVELQTFREFTEAQARLLAAELQGVHDARIVARYIEQHISAEVADRLEELGRGMRALRLEVTRGVAGLKLTLPPVAAAIAQELDATPATTSAAVAVGFVGAVGGLRSHRRETVQASPAGYLFLLGRRLGTTGLTARLRTIIRAPLGF